MTDDMSCTSLPLNIFKVVTVLHFHGLHHLLSCSTVLHHQPSAGCQGMVNEVGYNASRKLLGDNQVAWLASETTNSVNMDIRWQMYQSQTVMFDYKLNFEAAIAKYVPTPETRF
jgi:phosphodiesterase/alkaline phosphatase D-like protein